uniref:Choline/carnitine acyltransferase domain-containing protein n=1 Tax=Graphocephala atropunctata TaxID=36148 RepID=A0A1B6LDU7_9HEMI
MRASMSSQQQQFITDTKDSIRTFDYDDNLPDLPLPSLEFTIKCYLESVKPFAENYKEYQETKKIAQDFLSGEGLLLHSKLKQHAATHRNWVEKWWEDYAYLTLREPLIPHYNMVGPHPTLPGYPYGPGEQIRLASAYCHQMAKLWQLLREERLRPAVTATKQPLSMDQFRRIYNCSVTPGPAKDTIHEYFKTEREGSCSSQVVVLSRGHMFVVEAVRQDGQLLTQSEWEHQLTVVQQRAALHRGLDVPRLSCDHRSTWAQNRQHLRELAPENAAMLAIVDSAMFVLCLDDTCPTSSAAVSHQLLCGGDYRCRWPDHASNVIFFSNGLSGGLCVV